MSKILVRFGINWFVHRIGEFVDLPVRLVLADAIHFLNLASHLLALPGHDIDMVVGQLALFLLHFALELLPISFNLMPIHSILLNNCDVPR